MNALNTVRPSRAYKDGIGKPVVAKRWDQVVGAFRWSVVFPPCNSAGQWIVEPEAKMAHQAWRWCLWMNSKLALGAAKSLDEVKDGRA